MCINVGSFKLLHLQQCSHHGSHTALCINFGSSCRAALRVKVHLRRERLGVAIQQAWILLQDLHQLSAVQGGRLGRARARRMESLMKVCAHLAVMPRLLHVLQPDGILMAACVLAMVCKQHRLCLHVPVSVCCVDIYFVSCRKCGNEALLLQSRHAKLLLSSLSHEFLFPICCTLHPACLPTTTVSQCLIALCCRHVTLTRRT